MQTSMAFSVEYRMAPAQSCETFVSFGCASSPTPTELTLRLILPLSQARATAYTYDRLAFSFVYMSAILAAKTSSGSAFSQFLETRMHLPCINWNSPTGCPNCFLSCTYSTAMSKADCMRLRAVRNPEPYGAEEGSRTRVDHR